MAERKYIAYVQHHGTTDFNENPPRYTGYWDIPLNDKGILGAEKAAEFLSSCEIQSVYSSPLRRARRTAEIIVSRLGGRYICETSCLFPWHLPTLWGMEKSEFEEKLKPYVDKPNRRPEFGETLEEFRERIADFFEDKLSCHCPTLFVTHTSDIIALKESLTGEASSEKVVGPGGLVGIYEDGDGYGLEVLLGKEIEADYGK